MPGILSELEVETAEFSNELVSGQQVKTTSKELTELQL
jgi:hypothetical protein